MMIDGRIVEADIADAPEILALQKLAFYQEACRAGSFRIRPMLTSLEELEGSWGSHRYVKIVDAEGRIIASARGRMEGDTCHVGNVIVRPDRQGLGFGKAVLAGLEAAFPQANRFELFTAAASAPNIGFYQSRGYEIFLRRPPAANEPEMVFMEKREKIQNS
jgi:ribosomal protein S18 acetylase RimI-like enzyme